MNNPFLISIIIPVYNTEHYLRRCLDSVITQSLNAIEIIIINDGSTDGSKNIITSYQQCDSRIVVIHQSNQGLSTARNNGIKIAKGDYIAFLDSDDSMDQNTLEELYKTAYKTDADIVVGQIKTVLNEKIIRVSNLPLALSDYPFDNIIDYKISPSVCSKLYKKQLFINNHIRFPIGHNYEENITSIKLFFHAQKVAYRNNVYINYHRRDESITNTPSLQNMQDVFHMAYDCEAFLKEKNILNTYHHFILPRVTKILNAFIIPALKKDAHSHMVEIFAQTMQSSQLFSSTSLDKLKSTHPDYYLQLISNILFLHKCKNFFDFFLSLLPYELVAKLISTTLENHLLNYIQKREPIQIVLYGSGQIFSNIIHPLISHPAHIIGIYDQNLKTKKFYNLNVLTKDEVVKQTSPIIIASFAYADAIKKELLTLNPHLEIINIHDALSF